MLRRPTQDYRLDTSFFDSCKIQLENIIGTPEIPIPVIITVQDALQ